MANRQIKDQHGTAWDVWDVFPRDAVGQSAYDRRTPARPVGATAPTGPTDPVPMLASELEQGWLCFQAGTERRRFAPIPPQWTELPDGVLRVMLDIAAPVAPSIDPSPRPSTAE
ncbi:MAG: hypothetical protein JWM41_2133 [Gemmatimonadetes bacterium]|nr:hypothetical protein [Gemmatimonadota bacterium]